MLALGTTQGALYIVDVATMIGVMQWDAHAAPVLRVLFSPDERSLFSSCVDGMVRLLVSTCPSDVGLNHPLSLSLQVLQWSVLSEGHLLARLAVRAAGQEPRLPLAVRAVNPIPVFAMDREGTFLLVAANDGRVFAVDEMNKATSPSSDDDGTGGGRVAADLVPAVFVLDHNDAESVVCVEWCAETSIAFTCGATGAIKLHKLFNVTP